MAGLIAANLLRRHSPTILECQQYLPHNHSAVLRFRSPTLGDLLGIPMKRVVVRKGIWDGERVVSECTIPLANRYSLLTTGAALDRSIWNLEPEERWLPPVDFVERLAENVKIEFGFRLIGEGEREKEFPLISTAPLPVMLKIYGQEVSGFDFGAARQIDVVTCQVLNPRSEVYQTVYNADHNPRSSWYRASLEGPRLTVEFMEGPEVHWNPASFLYKIFGIPYATFPEIAWSHQKLGKILPVPEDLRRRAIHSLTVQHAVYSLGRYGTWRPRLLLDDLPKDVAFIERQILSDNYGRTLLS